MFIEACTVVRQAVYGLLATTQVGNDQINATTGTALMIAPGVLVTAAHLTYVGNDPGNGPHAGFEVVRAPDLGQSMERARLLAQDPVRDIALLQITKPRSAACAALVADLAPIGTPLGVLGFPLATLMPVAEGRVYNGIERYQAAAVSAHYRWRHPSGRELVSYETAGSLYPGSAGCAAFQAGGRVIGYHAGLMQHQAGGATAGVPVWVPASDIVAFAVRHGIKVAEPHLH